MLSKIKPHQKLLSEFKSFAIKGNVIDMAVGIVIGVSFGKIVTSLVNDVIMPPIGILLSGVDFSKLEIPLGTPSRSAEPVAIKYGEFINTVIDFILVAAVIFMLVRVINRLKNTPEETPAETTKPCPECCSSIPIAAKRCPQCTSTQPANES